MGSWQDFKCLIQRLAGYSVSVLRPTFNLSFKVFLQAVICLIV